MSTLLAGVTVAGTLSLSACIMPEPHADSVAVDGAGRLVSGDRSNDPLGPKVVSLRMRSEIGEWVVESYESELGGCIDVIDPEGVIDPHCDATSALGGPIGPINLASRWSEDEPMGPAHFGLVDPAVTLVRLEPRDSHDAPVAAATVAAANVPLQFVLITAPDHWTGYDIAAYGADGCLLHREPYFFPGDRPPPRQTRPTPVCSERLPEGQPPPDGQPGQR